MPSPFPGMDPYLEHPAFWPDYHYTFINYWREAIADALPEEYEATVGVQVYLADLEPETKKHGYPDVAVTRGNGSSENDTSRVATIATLEPVTLPLTMQDGPSETFVEILHQPERSLVTVLELLSPTNKRNPGRIQYLDKRYAVLNQQVHLVELDLLRGGQRLPMDKPLPDGDSFYILSRWEERPDSQVYYWTYEHPLPTLPVPLRAPDNDIQINLADVFGTAYDRGRFGRRLNYDGPPPAHLTTAEQSWAKKKLESR